MIQVIDSMPWVHCASGNVLYCILHLALYCVNVVNCILNIFRVLRQFSPGIHSSKLFHFPSPSQIPQYFERKQARQWKILFCQSENKNGNQSLEKSFSW